MPIVRAPHDENSFILDKTFIDDPNLSLKAKGIMAYLLTKPDTWHVVQQDIVKHCADGRRSVSAGIKELMEAGYMVRFPVRNTRRHMMRWDYDVYEVPKKMGP